MHPFLFLRVTDGREPEESRDVASRVAVRLSRVETPAAPRGVVPRLEITREFRRGRRSRGGGGDDVRGDGGAGARERVDPPGPLGREEEVDDASAVGEVAGA